MFGQLVGIFSHFFTKYVIAKTKILVKRREAQIDIGVLGRSLSCNTLLPRGFEAFYGNNFGQNSNVASVNSPTLKVKIIKSTKDLTKISDLANLSPFNVNVTTSTFALIIDTTLKSNIALVANARRYTPFLIIHKDIFISKYQILESLVFGADCIILSRNILSSESLQSLQSYANHLGLEVAIMDSKNHIFVQNSTNSTNVLNLAIEK